MNRRQRNLTYGLLLAGALGILLTARPPVALSSPAQEIICEDCWNEYFVWEWKHNFPDNDGMMNCNMGDGCHGNYFESGQCDDEHELCPFEEEADYDRALAGAQGRGELSVARQYLATGKAIIEPETGLFLVRGCEGRGIVASVSVPSARVHRQLTDDE